MYSTDMDNSPYSVVFAERRDVGREWNDVKWNKDHFQIQYHRLYYVTEGRASLKLQDRLITLEKGNIYFIPAFSVAESSIDGVMNKYYIHFAKDSPFLEIYRYVSGRFSVPAGENAEFLFNTVVENYASSTPSARMKVQGAMSLIMSDFLGDAFADSSAFSRFIPVLDYVNRHYRENITLSDLASQMNLCTMYFANLFKKTFNVSPKQFILNKRLTEGQRLLLTTRMSVKEIAYATGFENENYFSEFFTSRVGISALRFRSGRLPTTKDSIL